MSVEVCYTFFMAALISLWRAFSKAGNLEEGMSNPQERVLLILRAHPIVNLPWVLVGLILIGLPFIFSLFLSQLKLSSNQELFLVVLWYGFTFGYLLNKFYFWYFNLGVVTNQKIVDIDANNLLNTVTTATSIGKVEEVNKKSLGIVAGAFNYGDIFVMTAGEFPNIEFNRVPHPSEIVSIIHSNMRRNGRHLTR